MDKFALPLSVYMGALFPLRAPLVCVSSCADPMVGNVRVQVLANTSFASSEEGFPEGSPLLVARIA